MVYPNPVKDELNIQLSPNSGITEIFLLNSQGQKVKVIKVDTAAPIIKMKTSGLQPGTYFLCYSTGTKISHKKLIITP